MKKLSQICKDYWRQIIVILSLPALCLTLSNCKKKDPIVPPPPPVCETKTTNFVGTFRRGGVGVTTITIEFIKNNCPTEGSNNYVIKGLGESLEPFVVPNKTLTVQDYTFSSSQDDRVGKALSPITINLVEFRTNPFGFTLSTSLTSKTFTYNFIK